MLPDPVSRTELCPPTPPPPFLLLWSSSRCGCRRQAAGAGASGSGVALGWPLGRGRHLFQWMPCRCFLSANFRVCLLLHPLLRFPRLRTLSRLSPRSHCASVRTRLCLPRWETGHFALGDQAGVAGGGRHSAAGVQVKLLG